ARRCRGQAGLLGYPGYIFRTVWIVDIQKRAYDFCATTLLNHLFVTTCGGYTTKDQVAWNGAPPWIYVWHLRKGTRIPMEHRLRLVQGSNNSQSSEKRAAARRPISVPGQIVWKDARGTTRMASVVTRDVSDHGVAVECLSGTPIPLYRLVYFQL